MAKDIPNHESAPVEGKELNWREANRQIREEAKAEKAQSRSKARSAGAGLAVLERVQRRFPDNPKKQVAAFMDEFVIKAGTGRSRPVSERRRSGYADGLIGVINDLRTDRAPVSNLGEIGSKHALRLIKYWMKEGQGTKTIQNKISILRRFLTFIGKDKAIPGGQKLKSWLIENGIEAPNWGSAVATSSKAWDENGVEIQDVLARMREHSPITAMQLEVQAAFGLRMMESIQLDPRGADYGDMLRVVHGTKGGLPRDVPFDRDPGTAAWQRDVLERAKVFAAHHKKGILATPGNTLKQNRAAFYNNLIAVGITRKGLGVTAHGLRHQYAARRYTQISGLAVPVSKGAPLVVSDDVIEADLLARREVSRELGHFRDDVTKAYIGSLPMLEKTRKKRIFEWIERTEGNPRFGQILREAGVVGAWLGGKFANGQEVGVDEKLRLIVKTENAVPLGPDRAYLLTQSLTVLLPRGVDLSEHFYETSPLESLELLIRK